eukprot:1161306-Pelagomonas_calceolata.AAC.1
MASKSTVNSPSQVSSLWSRWQDTLQSKKTYSTAAHDQLRAISLCEAILLCLPGEVSCLETKRRQHSRTSLAVGALY